MDDFQRSAFEAAQREGRRIIDEYQSNKRHKEMLKAQTDLANSNNRLADEVQSISESLQTQIDENKLTEEKHDKRSKHEFRLSFAVAIVSAAIALAALFVAIFK